MFRISDLPAGLIIVKAAAVLVGSNPDSLVTTRSQTITAVFGGIAGDRHFGQTHKSGGRTKFYPRGTEIFNERQLSLVSSEELAAAAEKMGIPEILPEWLGANVLLSGIPDLTSLSPGTRLAFSSGAVVYVTSSNNPCVGPGNIIQNMFPERTGLSAAFVQHAMHRRGIVAVVDIPGLISEGDDVALIQEQRYLYQH